MKTRRGNETQGVSRDPVSAKDLSGTLGETSMGSED